MDRESLFAQVGYCGDCGVMEGELHLPGCDMEECLDCGGQLISCGHNPERRTPFIFYPLICGRCGLLFPAMYMVPDEVWKYYIAPKMRDKVLCWECFDHIRQGTDLHQGLPPFGPYEVSLDSDRVVSFFESMASRAEEAGYREMGEALRQQGEDLRTKLIEAEKQQRLRPEERVGGRV